MKTLEAQFTGKGEVSGIIFNRIFRFDDLCLYRRSDGCYEVIRIRIQKAGIRKFGDNEIFYEEKEYYPKGEDWGKFEWCCNDIGRATIRFNQQAESLNYNIKLNQKIMERLQVKTALENTQKYFATTDDTEDLDTFFGRCGMFPDESHEVVLGSAEHFNIYPDEVLASFNQEMNLYFLAQ